MTPAEPRSPIALFGGTFDPVHLGHLRPALELLQGLGFAQLQLVPAHIPPHRDPPRASPARRLELLRTAVDGVPGLSVDDRELRRDGPSYTLETLRRFRAEIGSGRSLCFVMGADAFRGLTAWHGWRQLTDYAHLVVMRRPGVTLDDLSEPLSSWFAERCIDREQLRRRRCGGVRVESVSPVHVSATGIRRAMAQGLSGRYLVPDSVWRAIAGAGIYGYPQP